jgi:phosphoglycerol transferase MdoB-like AlkP superfamily enzyme
MMALSVPRYVGKEPFHAYYMTVSGHMRYSFGSNAMAAKHRETVAGLPYSDEAQAYLATQVELDQAMASLLAQLEAAGVAERTLIAMSADHYPYGLSDKALDELAGHKVERNFELYQSPWILYNPGQTPLVIEAPCSSLDMIPTLSNLLGLDFDSRLLMGRDVFSDGEPLVMFLNKSFITSKGRYDAVKREFVPAEGVEPLQDPGMYVRRLTKVIEDKFHYSAKILDKDYYRLLK